MKTRFIKHNLPVFYNPENNGLHVLHLGHPNGNNKTVVVGGCCDFYDDAYTNICRYEIPVKLLRTWKRINKRELNSYSFLQKYQLFSNELSIKIKDEDTHQDLRRAMWCENPKIIKHWYEHREM